MNLKYLLILLLYGINCEPNDYFVVTPEDVSVVSGGNASLKCKCRENISAVKYEWKHNGKVVRSSARRRILNGNLTIKRVDENEDTGKYVCEAVHLMTDERFVTKTATLRVYWIDKNASVVLNYPEQSSQITLSRPVKLKCLINGSEKIRIDWQRNGERITKSDRVFLEGRVLHLKDIKSNDNGVYRCNASNEAGTVLSRKNFALIVPSDNWATIQVIPEDEVVRFGTSVRLDCVYRNADRLEWYFQERGPLEGDTRRTILSNGSLLVNSMSEADEGLYACVGVKKESTAVPPKYTAILSLAYIANMDETNLEPSNPAFHVIAENSIFEIKCFPPRGNPPPTITWLNFAGQPLVNTSKITLINDNLVIHNTNVISDSGSYTCRAENIAGIKSISFNLTVVVKPEIIKHPKPVQTNEGADFMLMCEYAGTPYPATKVSWYKDNMPLSTNTSRIFVDSMNGTLYVADVELSDSGTYYCIVRTAPFDAVKSQSASVFVQQKLKFHPLPMGKKMELGMSNKIPCKAEGKDVPTVNWIRGDYTANPEPLPSDVQDLNGTLHFNKVHHSNRGKYTCIASNSQGEIHVTVDVDVVVTPKFIVLPKNPTEAVEGASVRLDCVAEGDPTPTVQWDNKLVDLNQKRFHVFPNGSLLIDALLTSDEGYYGCTAGNSGGFNRTEIMLLVRASDNFKSDGTIDSIEGDTVGKTIVITLGAACAYILLVIILMAWCWYRRKKKKQAYAEANADSVHLDDDGTIDKYNSRNPVELKETVIVQNGHTGTANDDDDSAPNASHSTNRSKRSSEGYENSHFSRKNVHNLMLLGEGEFGSVYLAQNSKNADTIVMVKVLDEINDEFKRQFNLLSNVEHEHVARLIGLCKEAKPYYLILEYTDWGDLKQFLIATRKSSVGVVGNKERPVPLTFPQILVIVKQTAAALEYLTGLNHTHRDVAARNCLITSSLNIKITFSSLSKTTYAGEYHKFRNHILPLRWLPKEAVFENTFTEKTDVYSFACLTWELFTKGEIPFSKFSNKEFVSLLEKGQLQWKVPKSVPAQLENLLVKCWSRAADDRPAFSDIGVEVANINI